MEARERRRKKKGTETKFSCMNGETIFHLKLNFRNRFVFRHFNSIQFQFSLRSNQIFQRYRLIFYTIRENILFVNQKIEDRSN